MEIFRRKVRRGWSEIIGGRIELVSYGGWENNLLPELSPREERDGKK